MGPPLRFTFQPFRTLQLDNPFFKASTAENERFAVEDLAKSGLIPTDMAAYYVVKLKDGVNAGYGIPYFGLNGQPLTTPEGYMSMYRVRLKRPEVSKDPRYDQPSNEQLAAHGIPGNIPYIHPCTLTLPGDTLVCAEGEKKTASILRHLGLPAFGIGGCQNWRNPDRSGGIHPWIRGLLKQRGINRVLIVPDGDLLRYDICNAYGTFAHTLRAEGYTVEIVSPPGKIDDLLVAWGDDARGNFESLERIDPQALVQSPASLAKRYNLAFRKDKDGVAIPFQHSSNVMKLIEEHSAFPKFWRNLDNNRIMVGEEAAQPDFTEMEIANYFQYNLGFDKVGHRLVYPCIQALAKKHARSPFLDYVRAQIWDATPRLDSWLCSTWGLPDTDFVKEIAVKWLVSACARMDKPGTKIDWMLIVIGPQGVGKTSMPSILFKDCYRVLYGENNDKDLHMLLHSSLCVGFDELDSFGRKESSMLKAMITRQEDAFRPPYGASIEIFPRRFVLYGSGNRYEFLQSDTSGYRRYAVIEVAKLLDFAGLDAIRDQLWAEAWHRYQQGGCKFWEIDGATANAEKYVIEDPREEQIISFIERAKMEKMDLRIMDGKLYFTMNDILTHLEIPKSGPNSSTIRDLAGILRKIGAVKSDKTLRHPKTGVVGKFYTLDL